MTNGLTIIKDQVTREQYTALAAETNFSYPFKITAEGYVVVWQTPLGQTPDPVLDLLVLNVDYTVTGVGDVDGGDIVLVVPATAGDIITLERDIPIERLADYSVGGDFSGASINQQLDKLTMTQQQNETVNETRQLTYSPTDELTTGDVNLPKLATGQFWKKGDAGALIAVTLEESAGWSALRSELANNLSGADGARIVGFYSQPNSSTTVKDEFDYLYNLIQNFIRDSIPTGIAWLYIGTTAPGGWILMNDGTIGDAGSGATTRANADCENLFKLIWDSVIDAWAPVSTGRGASAQADWDAGKTITLTRQLGRAIAITGTGAGLTTRVHGSYLGEEDHQLTIAELAIHNHAPPAAGNTYAADKSPSGTAAAPVGIDLVFGTMPTTGSDQAHNTMQPSAFWNIIIKL